MATQGKTRFAATRKRHPLKSPPASQPEAAQNNGSSASNLATLRRMYSAMLKCRMIAEHMSELAAIGYDLRIGREAVVVGATIDLLPDDNIVASWRNLAAYIATHTSLKPLLRDSVVSSEIPPTLSIVSGVCAPEHAIFSAAFPADPFNLATGLALSHKLQKKTRVAVAFCDEDAGSLETSHAALKYAGIHKLPILYVTRGGSFSELATRKHNALEEFSFVAKDYGFPSILVDGNDVVAVWRAAQESIHRARQGTGPTLIECQTEAVNFDDPLTHLQHYMSKRGGWEDAWKQQVVDQITAEIAELQTPQPQIQQ